MERTHQETYAPKVYFLPGAIITKRAYTLATQLAQEIIDPETLDRIDAQDLSTRELHELNNLIAFQDSTGERKYNQQHRCGVCHKEVASFRRGKGLNVQNSRILDLQVFCAQVRVRVDVCALHCRYPAVYDSVLVFAHMVANTHFSAFSAKRAGKIWTSCTLLNPTPLCREQRFNIRPSWKSKSRPSVWFVLAEPVSAARCVPETTRGAPGLDVC